MSRPGAPVSKTIGDVPAIHCAPNYDEDAGCVVKYLVEKEVATL